MDVVVTVPKNFRYETSPRVGLGAWIDEGDAAGSEWTGQEWYFTIWNPSPPKIEPGERVYVVCNGKLRGYAPLIRLEVHDRAIQLVRGGGAVAVTLPGPVIGFRGWRYRWWDREIELPFPNWMED